MSNLILFLNPCMLLLHKPHYHLCMNWDGWNLKRAISKLFSEFDLSGPVFPNLEVTTLEGSRKQCAVLVVTVVMVLPATTTTAYRWWWRSFLVLCATLAQVVLVCHLLYRPLHWALLSWCFPMIEVQKVVLKMLSHRLMIICYRLHIRPEEYFGVWFGWYIHWAHEVKWGGGRIVCPLLTWHTVPPQHNQMSLSKLFLNVWFQYYVSVVLYFKF